MESRNMNRGEAKLDPDLDAGKLQEPTSLSMVVTWLPQHLTLVLTSL